MHEPPLHHSAHIHVSPAHIIPFVYDHFVGTSSRATHVSLDDKLNEMRAWSAMDSERDIMIYAMHQNKHI